MKTNIRNFCTRILVSFLLLVPTLHRSDAEPSAGDITAADLASLYQRDPQSAKTNYTGKKITIKGKVKDMQYNKGRTAGESIVTIAFETPLGTSAIRVSPIALSGLIAEKDSEGSHNTYSMSEAQHELKFSEGHLSMRLFWAHSYENTGSGYNYHGSYKRYGEWIKLLSIGDEVAITGVCQGKSMDITISDASF